MKKHLLIGASLLALGITTTAIYAQVTGTSVVDKMKAVAHSFTLAATLNPSDSGLTSDPVKGKKTGDILTAGEWNRMLELVSEGGGGGAGWVDVPLTDTNPFDKTCEYRFTLNTNGDNASIGGTNPVFYASAIDPFAITYIAHSSVVTHILASSKNAYRINGTESYTVTKIEKLCGGGSGGGGSSSSELQLSNESPTTVPNFIEATKYCKNLTEGGYSDWRFPNLSELFVFAPISTDTNFLWTNAVDYSQGTANANPQYWGKLRMSDGYFSATSGPGDDVAYVRCVRGS